MCQTYVLIFVVVIVGKFFYECGKRYESFWKHIYAIPGPDYFPIIGNTDSLNKDPGTNINFVGFFRKTSFAEVIARLNSNFILLFTILALRHEGVELEEFHFPEFFTKMKHIISVGFSHLCLYLFDLNSFISFNLLQWSYLKWERKRYRNMVQFIKFSF